jgi:hypothetical protein
VDNYYHYDAIGNVAMTSNSSGGLVSAIDQEAYGNVKIGSQSGYHLTTKEYDSNPELYYFEQTWYDPMLGRLINNTIEYVDINEMTEPEIEFSDNQINTCIDQTISMMIEQGNLYNAECVFNNCLQQGPSLRIQDESDVPGCGGLDCKTREGECFDRCFGQCYRMGRRGRAFYSCLTNHCMKICLRSAQRLHGPLYPEDKPPWKWK